MQDTPAATSAPSAGVSAPSRTVDAATLGRATAAPVAPSATSNEASGEPESVGVNRRVLFGAVAGVLAVVVIVAIAIRGLGDDQPAAPSLPPPSSVAGSSDAPMMMVAPPADLEVRRVENGFRFSWSPATDGDGAQLIRQGTDDSIIADDPPYLWTLDASADGDCFVARGTRGGRMSTRLTEPVCVTG